MKKTMLAAVALGLSAGAAPAQTNPPTPAAPKKPLTDDGGRPVGDNQNSRTSGENGPVLLDNFHLLQKLGRFDRERIPERVVHARGAGAHGEFVAASDFSALTRAKPFAAEGKKTPVFVRFSTVIHPNGSPEQLRDPRGFAVKFYTEEGNWDLVGNNLPVFFIRDAIKFPDFIHAFKPSPVTNQQEPNRQFDFLAMVPESTHMLTFLFSDQGTPKNYRQMDGFGVHAFKWVTAKGDVTYVKFNWHSNQGLATNTMAEAKAAAAENQSGFTQDLYDNINKGQFPSWDLYVQLVKPADLDKFDFDALDDTKVWPGIPETKVGTMTLNKVPDNFFQFTEQSAFSPGVMIPGVEASEDKMLQGRLFSYADTQLYRVGTNYLMLPVNRPYATVSSNNQDGLLNHGHTVGDVNYEPSVSQGRRDDADKKLAAPTPGGSATQRPIKKTQDFQQAGGLYRSFTDGQKANLIKNLAGDLNKVKDARVKVLMVSHFLQADADYGTRLAQATNVNLDEVKALIAAKADATRDR